MNRKTSLLIVAAFLSGLCSAQAEQYFLGKLEDGPHIGVVTGGDTDSDALALGWQVQYNVNSYWSWDASITHHQEDLRVSPLGLPEGSMDTEFYKLHWTLRLNLLAGKKFNAYVGAGAHYMIHREKWKPSSPPPAPITSVQAELKDDIGLHGAAGLEWLINQDWELFLEGQYAAFETDLVLDVAAEGASTTEIREEVPYDHVTVRLGLNFRF